MQGLKMVTPIEALFITTTGRWDEIREEYVDIKKTSRRKEINLFIDSDGDSRRIIGFRGGPTGHESYYLQDLIDRPPVETLCICGGTINKYDECRVSATVVNEAIAEFLEKETMLKEAASSGSFMTTLIKDPTIAGIGIVTNDDKSPISLADLQRILQSLSMEELGELMNVMGRPDEYQVIEDILNEKIKKFAREKKDGNDSKS